MQLPNLCRLIEVGACCEGADLNKLIGCVSRQEREKVLEDYGYAYFLPGETTAKLVWDDLQPTTESIPLLERDAVQKNMLDESTSFFTMCDFRGEILGGLETNMTVFCYDRTNELAAAMSVSVPDEEGMRAYVDDARSTPDSTTLLTTPGRGSFGLEYACSINANCGLRERGLGRGLIAAMRSSICKEFLPVYASLFDESCTKSADIKLSTIVSACVVSLYALQTAMPFWERVDFRVADDDGSRMVSYVVLTDTSRSKLAKLSRMTPDSVEGQKITEELIRGQIESMIRLLKPNAIEWFSVKADVITREVKRLDLGTELSKQMHPLVKKLLFTMIICEERHRNFASGPTFEAAEAIAYVWGWGSTDHQTSLAIDVVDARGHDAIDVLMDVITGLEHGFSSRQKPLKEEATDIDWLTKRERFDWMVDVMDDEPKDLLTLAVENRELEWAESLIRNKYNFIEAHVFDARQSAPMKAALDLELDDKLAPPLTQQECQALERIKRKITEFYRSLKDLVESHVFKDFLDCL